VSRHNVETLPTGAVGSDRAKQLIRIEKRQKKGQIHDVIGEKRLPKA